MADAPFKNIVIVGASGSVGKPTLDALLRSDKHNITAISRKSSTAQLPSGVTVKSGDYDDEAFMVSALKGQDVVVIMLAFAGLKDQDKIFEAAAKAGVKYVLPSEYGMDSGPERNVQTVPLVATKRKDQETIKKLGMKYIAVCTNLWTDYTIEHRIAGLDMAEKKATIFEDSGHFHTTTTAQVGRGIAAVLSLPVSTLDKEFANGTLYLSSFQITHPQLFEAILKATGGKETDWTIERKSCDDLLKEGKAKMEAGDHSGIWELLYGATFHKDFTAERGDFSHSEMLGLPKEDLVEVIQDAAKKIKADGPAGAVLSGARK